MGMMFVGCLAFLQYVTERGEESVIPIVIHKPFSLNGRDVVLLDALCHTLFLSALVLVQDKLFIVFHVYLVVVSRHIVMAPEARFHLLVPNLYDTA